MEKCVRSYCWADFVTTYSSDNKLSILAKSSPTLACPLTHH